MYKNLKFCSCPLICQKLFGDQNLKLFSSSFLIRQNYVHNKSQIVFMSFNWSKVCIKYLGLPFISLIGRRIYKPKSQNVCMSCVWSLILYMLCFGHFTA